MPPQGRPQAAGRSSQFQPGKYEIFPGRGRDFTYLANWQLPGGGLVEALPLPQTKQSRWHRTRGLAKQALIALDVPKKAAKSALSCLVWLPGYQKKGLVASGCPGFWLSNQKVSQKPARSQPNLFFWQGSGPGRELRKCSLFGMSKAIDAWAASQAHAWNCAIYCASFVGGAVPPQGRPQAAGRSSQIQPGKRPDLAREPGPCRELRKCSLFRDVQDDRSLGCFASPRVELCHLLCFVCGRGKPARSQPEASQKPTKPLFLIARSQPNQASRGLIWQGSLGLAGS